MDTTAFQHGETDWTYLADETDVQPGVLRVVDFAGVPVLLTRTGDEIVALADRCTHRGGPLHEGELVDGCVVCPWHGSAFALRRRGGRGPGHPAAAGVRGPDHRRSGVRPPRDEPRALRTKPVGV